MTDIYKLFYRSASTWLSYLDESNGSLQLRILNFLTALDVTTDEMTSPESHYATNFLWKLLVNQNEIDFFLLDNKKAASKQSTAIKNTKSNPKIQALINDFENRGYCPNYYERTNLSHVIKKEVATFSKTYKDYLDQLIIFCLFLKNIFIEI